MKNILLLAMCILAFHFAGAQDNNTAPAGSFQLGIEAGPSMALQRGVPFIATMTPFYGGSAGITATYNISGPFSLNAGLLFEQRGYAMNIMATDNNGNSIGTIAMRDQLNYITIPVLARYTVPGTLHFFFNGGPYFGSLLSDISTSTFNNVKSTTDNSADDKHLDAGLCLGLGIDKPVSDKITLDLELRGSYGLLSVAPVLNPAINGTYNEALVLLIGARYRL